MTTNEKMDCLGKIHDLQFYLAENPEHHVDFEDKFGRRLRLSLDDDLDPQLIDLDKPSSPWVPNLGLTDWLDVIKREVE